MSEIDTQSETLEQHLTPSGSSQDPDYLAWKEGKIKNALKNAKNHPENRIPQQDIWDEFAE